MSRLPPPLRFLSVAITGWLCVRAAMLAPDFWRVEGGSEPQSTAAAASAKARPAAAAAAAAEKSTASRSDRLPRAGRSIVYATPEAGDRRHRLRPESARRAAVAASSPAPAGSPAARAMLTVACARQQPMTPPFNRPPELPARSGRWSASAWLLARPQRSGEALAPGGTLGGSQAGARLTYRINGDAQRPLSVSTRLYMPLRDRRGAEAGVGLDWRPFGPLPLHILAERRQVLGREGRSAFALTLYGGGSGRIATRVQAEAYVQAGIVGHRSKDAFFDGAVRAGVPIGRRVEVGAGVWAAAQPGAERVDLGPQLSVRLPGSAGLRLRADWRFRVAGAARPQSGPAVTLAADF